MDRDWTHNAHLTMSCPLLFVSVCPLFIIPLSCTSPVMSMSTPPTNHRRTLSHGGGGSRRGSFASGSRRGSLCPRISSDVASRLVLNALFGYIHVR